MVSKSVIRELIDRFRKQRDNSCELYRDTEYQQVLNDFVDTCVVADYQDSSEYMAGVLSGMFGIATIATQDELIGHALRRIVEKKRDAGVEPGPLVVDHRTVMQEIHHLLLHMVEIAAERYDKVDFMCTLGSCSKGDG